MILEVAILDIKADETEQFEAAYNKAQHYLASRSGYHGHQLQRCLEQSNRYILLVHWATLEDHTVGFRESAEYEQWRTLIHPFLDGKPSVQHYEELKRD